MLVAEYCEPLLYFVAELAENHLPYADSQHGRKGTLHLYMGGFADFVLKRKRILPMNYAKMK